MLLLQDFTEREDAGVVGAEGDFLMWFASVLSPPVGEYFRT